MRTDGPTLRHFFQSEARLDDIVPELSDACDFAQYLSLCIGRLSGAAVFVDR